MTKTTVTLTPVTTPSNVVPLAQRFPLYASRISAGFPSPADDFAEAQLNLNAHLVKHPAATFFVKVSGHSMLGAGIHDGDLLIVDRAVSPEDGKIVIAVVDGELTVKRLSQQKDKLYLAPENDDYPAIEVRESSEFSIWGVVTTVIHPV
jgi:DNA polymerase V